MVKGKNCPGQEDLFTSETSNEQSTVFCADTLLDCAVQNGGMCTAAIFLETCTQKCMTQFSFHVRPN